MSNFILKIDEESWNAFLDQITQPYCYEERCAWLFCDKPFCLDNKVYVFPVENVGLKGYSKEEAFAPNRKELQKVKRIARKKKLTRIGNLHTHVLTPNYEPLDFDYDSFCLPSELDLKYAKKFNDIIRGIITVVFSKDGERGMVWDVVWHDQYGNILSRLRRGF